VSLFEFHKTFVSKLLDTDKIGSVHLPRCFFAFACHPDRTLTYRSKEKPKW
jgi:hypothetical protein